MLADVNLRRFTWVVSPAAGLDFQPQTRLFGTSNQYRASAVI
jgi:hypothetical protein